MAEVDQLDPRVEALEIKKELDLLRARIANPQGATEDERDTDRILAQRRLDKVTDDYRLILGAIAGTPAPPRTPSAAHELERLDARGDVIRAGQPNQNAPVVKVRDPRLGTITDMPDLKSVPAEGKTVEFGEQLLWVTPDGNFTVMASKPGAGTKTTTFQGPDGSQWEYDPSKPAGQRASQLVAGKPKPEVTNPNEIVWTDIPGTNSQQANRVVDGKPQAIEGVTKPKTTTMVGDAKSKKWSFLDAEGNVVRTVDNPGYVDTKTTLSTPADQQYILQQNPDGTTSTIENPNYRPKTSADVAARTGQLQSLMVAKGKELQEQYKDNPQEGVRLFNQWYDQNVQGQLASLQQAAEEANFTRAKEIADQRRQALQQAQTAGQQAISAYQASGLSRVGPRAAEVANQVSKGGFGALKNVDWQGAAFFNDTGPGSVQGRADAATQKAYADLVSGIPQYTPLAPGAELDRLKYTPQFMPKPVVPVPPVPPPGGGAVDWRRADQTYGTAPPGDALAQPGVAGAVKPGSPVFLGSVAPPVLEEPPPDLAEVAPMMEEAPYVPPAARVPQAARVPRVAPLVMPAAPPPPVPMPVEAPGLGFDPTNIQVVQGPQGPRALAAARRGLYPYEMPGYIPPRYLPRGGGGMPLPYARD